MDEIISFDELAKVVPRIIINPEEYDKLNEIIRNGANYSAGEDVEKATFLIRFSPDPKSDALPLKKRISIIYELEDAGYKHISRRNDAYSIIDEFKLPVAVTTLSTVKPLDLADFWSKGGHVG